MKTLRTLLLFTAVAALAACSKLTEDNLQKIKPGMTTDQVEEILGKPTSSQTGSALGLVSGTTYIYHTDKSDVKINFVDGKVVTTEGSFQ
jgi:outer membrane protein assembly factor BamE (lipoprotein component of BamABCDE complex)